MGAARSVGLGGVGWIRACEFGWGANYHTIESDDPGPDQCRPVPKIRAFRKQDTEHVSMT
jgi:hypothetical protein